MRVLILGSGLMGPTAAYNAMSDSDVSQIVVCDRDQGQLDACFKKLTSKKGVEKLNTVRLDLGDRDAIEALMAGFDVTISALPGSASVLAIRAALRSGTPLVDLARLDDNQLPEPRFEGQSSDGLVVLECGLEPGLTEIMARYLAEKLDRVDELHIKCGGIPEKPMPPLGYKIVFGGQQLPLDESDVFAVVAGRLESVPRYSSVERSCLS